jgi:peptide/nickel transport system permease protein
MKRLITILKRAGACLSETGPSLVFAWAVFVLALLCAAAPGLFTRQNPVMGIPNEHLLPPSPAHPLGTDALGRDSLARVIYGASHSLFGAFIAVASGLLIGTALGLVAGSLGGKIEDTIMRFVDVLLSIPRLLLSLSVIVILGFGSFNVALAVGLTSIASFARLARSEVVKVRGTDYVEAAFGSGGSFFGVLRRHILPNSITSVIAFAALQYGSAILQMSTLGFLGYGAPPPTPEWGLLIAEGRNYVATAWWLTTAPGLAVLCTVLSLNRISRSFEKDIA